MNKLETDLRQVLNKYGFECHRISIIFTHSDKDIMAIEIENIEEKNENSRSNNFIRR